MNVNKTYLVIQRIVIFPMHSAIQSLNNWGLMQVGLHN